MKNSKLAILIACAAISTQMLSAQQVYQAHHYGSPGEEYLYNRFTSGFSNEDMTASGANITWDMSTNLALNTHLVEIVEPAEGINQFNFLTICPLGGLSALECLELWTNTDQAVLLKDSLILLDFTLRNLQRYQTKENNLLLENFIGFTVDLGGLPTQAVIVYQNQDTVIHFPVQYGNEWTSKTTYGLDLNPAGENILYSATQTRITTIDGWGTLMTPYDTFENVVRLRSEILRLDTIVQDDTDTTTIIADQIEFMWLDTNYLLPVMTANGYITPDDSVVINALEYIYDEACAEPTWSVDLGGQVFYLDATGSVEINFTILDSNADAFTWDFGDGQVGETSGDTTHVYTEPGIYTGAVIGCMTNCLPLNSCDFQIFEFEILDTITSLVNIEGEKLGITVSPNPADDFLNVFIPSTRGQQHYKIIDMTGRPVQSGTIRAGNSEIDTKTISNGLYTLQLVSPEDPSATVAFIRCIINR
jgi:hypothetical protein